MHTTLPPLGNPPQRGSVVYMHTHMGNEWKRKEPKEKTWGQAPTPPAFTGGYAPHRQRKR